MIVELAVMGEPRCLGSLNAESVPRAGETVTVDTDGTVARYIVASVEWKYYRVPGGPRAPGGIVRQEDVIVWLQPLDAGRAQDLSPQEKLRLRWSKDPMPIIDEHKGEVIGIVTGGWERFMDTVEVEKHLVGALREVHKNRQQPVPPAEIDEEDD